MLLILPKYCDKKVPFAEVNIKTDKNKWKICLGFPDAFKYEFKVSIFKILFCQNFAGNKCNFAKVNIKINKTICWKVVGDDRIHTNMNLEISISKILFCRYTITVPRLRSALLFSPKTTHLHPFPMGNPVRHGLPAPQRALWGRGVHPGRQQG